MHPTAKRCIQWASTLLVAGAILLVYGPNLYAGIVDVAGANAEIGLHVLDVALTLVSSLVFPLGAALIGAAVVIETVAPRGTPRPLGSDADAEADEHGFGAT